MALGEKFIIYLFLYYGITSLHDKAIGRFEILNDYLPDVFLPRFALSW